MVNEFPYHKELLSKEKNTLPDAPSGSEFFSLREVYILKMNAIVENYCLIKWSPFDVRNFFSAVATPLQSMDVDEGSEVWPASL